MDRITFIRYVAVGSSSVIRHLAAILAADIVGYSAQMGADQEGTLTALRQLRSELFGPTVAGNRGKVIKSMGDGWLVEFSSAVDAVTCAMQVQDRLAGPETIR
jgi:adenylate cyclase